MKHKERIPKVNIVDDFGRNIVTNMCIAYNSAPADGRKKAVAKVLEDSMPDIDKMTDILHGMFPKMTWEKTKKDIVCGAIMDLFLKKCNDAQK